MRITVTTLTDEIFNLDVSEDLELENFKAFCEVESGIPSAEIDILFEGKTLTTNEVSLKNHGLKDGDMVVLQRRAAQRLAGALQRNAAASLPGLDFSRIPIPGSSRQAQQPSARRQENDPSFVRDMFLANPDQLAILKMNNPRLADALLSGDLARFTEVLQQQESTRKERERLQAAMSSADAFDIEAQRLIADEIRRKNVEANMEVAIEYHPESFGTVVMLYINCKVNGHPVKAFIDSGAQTTIMSSACAERCNIGRLVDSRWAGIAKGVGTQKIVGRIHMVQLQIKEDFFPVSFSILEQQHMDMLLGLDMLKRHQCLIDLKRNVLVIGTTGTETPFLSEGELPDSARLSGNAMEEDDQELAKALHESAAGASVAASAAHASSSSVSSILPSDRFTESDVKNLVGLGFPREQVIEELRRFNGDTTQATAALFAKSLKF